MAITPVDTSCSTSAEDAPLIKRRKTAASTRGRTATTSKSRGRTTTAVAPQPFAAEELEEEEQSNGSVSLALADPDLLNCPICYQLLRSPVYQCENGHIACASCCTTTLKNKCGNCRLPIENIRCRAIEQILESVRVRCQYKLYGCPDMLSYSKKVDHEKECTYFPCSCPCCDFVGTSKRMYNHFVLKHKDSCKQFYFNCITSISMDSTEEHVILREEHDGAVFVLYRCTQSLGSFYNVVCVAQSASKCSFSYELTANIGEDSIRVQSSVDIVSKWTPQPPTKVSLIIPSNFINTGQLLKLCLVIRRKPYRVG